MTNYSFIIPHHNSPDLLNRCLNSIPQREDIEIIVVDDNSDADKKPHVSRDDAKLIYIDAEHTKGAGRARNYGMKEARGKWLVFADCDDFFVAGFLDILDKYKDEDYEVVYHDADAVDTVTLKPLPKLLERHNAYFDAYNGNKESVDIIKFLIHSPWWKMVRRDFVEEYQIEFEPVPKGNDVFFTYQVGGFAKKVAVEKKKIYIYTYNTQGITNGKKNKLVYLSVLRNKKKSEEFYKFIGHPEWIVNGKNIWLRILKHEGVFKFMSILFSYLLNYKDIQSTRMEYVESIKKRLNR